MKREKHELMTCMIVATDRQTGGIYQRHLDKALFYFGDCEVLNSASEKACLVTHMVSPEHSYSQPALLFQSRETRMSKQITLARRNQATCELVQAIAVEKRCTS